MVDSSSSAGGIGRSDCIRALDRLNGVYRTVFPLEFNLYRFPSIAEAIGLLPQSFYLARFNSVQFYNESTAATTSNRRAIPFHCCNLYTRTELQKFW